MERGNGAREASDTVLPPVTVSDDEVVPYSTPCQPSLMPSFRHTTPVKLSEQSVQTIFALLHCDNDAVGGVLHPAGLAMHGGEEDRSVQVAKDEPT